MNLRGKFVVYFLLAFGLPLMTSRFASSLEVGDKAPEFELESTSGSKLRLSSLRGKNVLINFYVLDFSPT